MNLSKYEYPVQRIGVKLKPAAEKKVKQGHPWVFDQGIATQKKEPKTGDLAILFDQKKNRLLGIGLWDTYSPIRIKMLHTGSPANMDTTFFKTKIQDAAQLRQPLLKTDTNSYRLIFGENDGLPGLIADVYDQVLVVKLYSGMWLPHLTAVLEPLLECSGCQTMVLRLSRQLQQQATWPAALKDGTILAGQLDQEEIIFREYGLKFAANVIHGHKTGYFLDHRHNRHQVRQLSAGKSVLDIFAYAGGFSVHALAGGAKEVLSIDISTQALAMAQKNAALNQLDAQLNTWAIDAFEGLKQLHKQGKTFDLVIVDPPAFAKQAKEVPTALHQYQRLTQLAIPLVAKGGMLLSASCSSRVLAEDFYAVNEKVLKAAGRKWTIWKKTAHDVDHPIGFSEGAYLKSAYYRLQ